LVKENGDEPAAEPLVEAGEDEAPAVVFFFCDEGTTGATGEIKAHCDIESDSCWSSVLGAAGFLLFRPVETLQSACEVNKTTASRARRQ
jgi:hypothetical protein